MSTGPRDVISIRQIDACESCDRQAIPTGASNAHATAALIGETCETTATVSSTGLLGDLGTGRPHPGIERDERLPALRRESRILPPVLPRIGRHGVGQGPSFEGTVGQLDPAVVGLERHPERLGRLPRPDQWAADEHVDGSDVGGHRLRLSMAHVVERLVDAALEAPAGVQRGAAVADEDEHHASEAGPPLPR